MNFNIKDKKLQFIIELFTHSSNPGPMVHTNLI